MQKRIEWIDCAKLVAMMAVVTDHCNGFLYTKPLVACASYYSVSLFVLLAGISTWISFERGKDVSFNNQLKKIIKTLSVYAVATLVVMCITQRRFDLITYLSYLVGFNIQGPYYYLVFFIQLLMVAPILIKWCAFINRKKNKWFMQIGTLVTLGWFAYISINFTYVLPVHGGGKFLGGGHLCNLILFGHGTGKQRDIYTEYEHADSYSSFKRQFISNMAYVDGRKAASI